MRSTTCFTLAALLGALAPLSVTASAGAAEPSAAPATESFVMTFQTFDGVDQPTRVSATGPVQGAGTETQTDVESPAGDTVSFTLHLQRGEVYLVAEEDYAMTFDPQACTAKAVGTGTWSITGGTGAFTGATGSGTFSDHGSFTGARDHGTCEGPESAMPPRTAVFTLTASGTAELGS